MCMNTAIAKRIVFITMMIQIACRWTCAASGSIVPPAIRRMDELFIKTGKAKKDRPRRNSRKE